MSAPIDVGNNLIMQELSYDINVLQAEADKLIPSLTNEQKSIFDKVMSTVSNDNGGFFFVYGFGGIGKTFLWNALTSSLRAQSKIVLIIASSGIAATLLPSGRTAHSRFAIPIQVNETSMCSISQGSPLAKLLECTKLIICNEALMVQRYCIEAFDHSLKDLIHSNLPFRAKCIIMGGDFRQILPVVPKGSRASVVNACICSSYLWSSCTIFTLTKNMRLTTLGSEEDKKKLEWFSKWLLDVGDGKLGEPNDGTTDIEVPKALLVNDYEDTIEGIVSVIYGDVIANLSNNEYFNDRAILAPTIEMVDKINQYMCSLLPGEAHEFFSSDSVCQASNQRTALTIYTLLNF
ncbi:uncharacterized protein LOC114716448 [Neltuma alba]|uniref:uncharacterized protein LOC114716448 n=1 Tax=Neltuma alba TaxID=207710 RepID=UPI0010A4B31F|nr:uncharacterized protein LOC114716448 [Prosopis alba]